MIALGHTNAEIGKQLYLSVRTVETHRAHIQQKLRRTSRAELVRYALDNGLVEIETRHTTGERDQSRSRAMCKPCDADGWDVRRGPPSAASSPTSATATSRTGRARSTSGRPPGDGTDERAGPWRTTTTATAGALWYSWPTVWYGSQCARDLADPFARDVDRNEE